MAEYETLVHRWFEEVWNQKREEAIDELFAADGIAHGLVDENGKEIVGAAAFKPFFRKFVTTFPDLHMTVEDTVVQENKVAWRVVVRGTHTGDGLGFAATGKPVQFDAQGISYFKDGKIQEAWNMVDFMSMFQQLGVGPS